jgi:hypothetical protein
MRRVRRWHSREPAMIIEHRTSLNPAAVLALAKTFFARRNPLYAAFLEKEGDTFATFRGQGGEELVIGVAPVDGGTAVRASTYLFDMQAQRFFAMLPPMATPAGVIA